MDKKELLSMLGGLYLQREELAQNVQTIDAQINKLKIDLHILRKAEQQKEPETPQIDPD